MILRGRRMESGSSPSLTSSDYDGANMNEPDWQIVVSSLDGTTIRELTKSIPIPENGCWANPSWSPDGTRIAASLLRNCYDELDEVWIRSYLFPVGTGPPRVIVGATPSCVVSGRDEARLPRQHVTRRRLRGRECALRRARRRLAGTLLAVSAADPWGAHPSGRRRAAASPTRRSKRARSRRSP